MKSLLLVIMLIGLAISGCTEKGPGESGKNAEELKNLSASSAENLSSYSIDSSVSQSWVLKAGPNATAGGSAKIDESIKTVSEVNLSGLMVHAIRSTQSRIEGDGMPGNESSSEGEFYQIGNDTYVQEEGGNWTHLVDPRPAREVWGEDRNNQVLSLARTFNLSQVQDMGSESVKGEDAYKLKIASGPEDQVNLFNIAFSVAAKLTQYPLYLPSINRTELNETAKMEKTIWISKSSNLPVKYDSSISFTMTPEVVGAMDLNTGKMNMFNQSRPLGEISVSTQTSDLFYDFNKPASITPPEEALAAPSLSPTTFQPIS